MTKEGIIKMVSIRASINKGLSPALKEAFPEVEPMMLPLAGDVSSQVNIINPNWITGFTDAEGCFFVVISENTDKGTYQVKLGYQLTQHIRDISFMKSLKDLFKCGITEPAGKTAISFRVSKIKDIITIIIPFFEKYPLLGSKSKDFKDWKEVVKIMESKDHLTQEGLNKIKKIKSQMNSLRKFPEES